MDIQVDLEVDILFIIIGYKLYKITRQMYNIHIS